MHLRGLRPVRDHDAVALQRLIGDVWGEYEGMVLDVDGEEPWLRQPAASTAAQGGRLWVLEEHGALVASVGIRPGTGAAVELKTLYVASGARRRGLGSALVRWAEEAARREGAPDIELWTDTRFTEAHRLYERLGYECGATRELHDLSNTSEFHYRRPL